jgi:hypothetical protein
MLTARHGALSVIALVAIGAAGFGLGRLLPEGSAEEPNTSTPTRTVLRGDDVKDVSRPSTPKITTRLPSAQNETGPTSGSTQSDQQQGTSTGGTTSTGSHTTLPPTTTHQPTQTTPPDPLDEES